MPPIEIVKTPKDIAVRLSGRTWTILLLPLGVAIVIFFLSLLHFLNIVRLEDRAQGYAIHYMKDFAGAEKFDRRIRIVLIPENDHGGEAPWGDIDKKHRKFFGNLVRAMAQARAKVVAFEIAFDKGSDFDKDFGAAIAEAERNNVRVILGVDSFETATGTDPKIPADFRHDRWATILVGGVLGTENAIATVKLADFNPSGAGPENPVVIPSLALRTVIDAHQPALEPKFSDDRSTLHLYSGGNLFRSIPLERESSLWLDQVTAEELQAVSVTAQTVLQDMSNPSALNDFQDSIVLVGYEHEDRRTTVSGDSRLGLELHATAISNIFNKVFIYRLPPLQNFLIILLMSFLGALFHTPIGEWAQRPVRIPIPWTTSQLPIPVGIIVVSAIYLIVAFMVYRLTRVYLDVCYHIAALLISYGALWFVLKKWFQKQPTLFTVK
jgi:CHASE2 domain-containing sensor protein